MLLDSANGKKFAIPEEIFTLYDADIDFQKLGLQLQLLPDAIKAVSPQSISVTRVTKVQTICDVFEEQSSLKIYYQKFTNSF